MKKTEKISVLLVYHFFYPDTVISAQLFSELAENLAQSGYAVTVFTCNRMIRGEQKLRACEDWKNVKINRFSRPNFSQSGNFSRLFNSAILQMKWLCAFWKQRKNFDSVIVGTDPQFAYMMFPILKMMNRKVRLIHWAFDLYPEAIQVNSPRWMKLLANVVKPFAALAYRCVDDMVDIGGNMRMRLKRYHHRARCLTLTPWALVEPENVRKPDADVRNKLFGNAKLGLLYSGTVGYAHDIMPFIELARECRRQHIDAAFCFAGYGNGYQAQTSVLTPEDTNIRLAGFTGEDELEKRLSAADIHLISLRPGWEGIVVPSKFFGALAIGRPILFSGPPSSEIAQWCEQFRIGYSLSDHTAAELAGLISDKCLLEQLRQQALGCYREHFSKQIVCNRWKTLLSSDEAKLKNNTSAF